MDPRIYTPQQITTIYKIPNRYFQTEHDVAHYNDYHFYQEKIIGRGGFSTVFLAKNIKTNRLAACKVIDMDVSKKFSLNLNEMKNELFIMEAINNPFTIKVFVHYLVNHKLFIFMMLANAGCFGKYLENNITLTENRSKYFFSMMLASIEYMHDCHIAHRDIKPDNFLMLNIDGHLVLMISDFGLSSFVSKDDSGKFELFQSQCGTPAFMAPEILKGESPYDAFKSDIWALGISLYMMICGSLPFDNNQDDWGVSDMEQQNWQYTLEMKSYPSQELNSILCTLLEPKPESRPKIKQLLIHQWIQKDYKEIKALEKVLQKNIHS
ncbi:protein kinase-like protein 9 [Sarcoptes scabiei]|nr:protein kinase-like protein 9 [Sarcoptes scabiei]